MWGSVQAFCGLHSANVRPVNVSGRDGFDRGLIGPRREGIKQACESYARYYIAVRKGRKHGSMGAHRQLIV